MRRRNIQILTGIVILVAISAWFVLTQDISFSLGSFTFERNGLTMGLDLKGGVHMVYRAKDPNVTAEQMKGVVNVIERRVNAFGVTEPVIQQKGANQILVELPGITDIATARRLIGETAQLDYREPLLDENGNQKKDEQGNDMWTPAVGVDTSGKEVHLTGGYLKSATTVVSQTTSEPVVDFTLNEEGGKIFKQITGRLVTRQYPLNRLAIFLDNKLVLAPQVKGEIEGSGVIEGLTLNEAQLVSIQLNAGALPVPLEKFEEDRIDPTLGSEHLRKSYIAGIIGLGLVLFFMIVYYKLPGVIANLALIMYAVLVLAIFKLIPVTLTLAGLAAFILSVGMAVDANILIFERTKEELRTGRTLGAAIEAGFDRAWPSIRDSNVSTFITCIILYWFGDRLAESSIMGFAITLFIGVALSMFTALFVSRSMLRAIGGTPLAKKLNLFTVL
ncbi:MAG: protein translocase subunit SecD [Chloroflexi bacterium]|nr:protein translocase subunit SecD [Chloroflexota bacterium]